METLLNTSAYESPALMAILFVLGTISIYFMIIPKKSEQKAPMHYYITKRELPQDDAYEKSSKWVWGIIITAIIVYYII